MCKKYLIAFSILIISICFLGIDICNATHTSISRTDTGSGSLYSFFDLRDRETFVQVTNTANPDVSNDIDVSGDVTIHVQIFNVDDNCNENNFFDTLTPNDTHVYNMRDIKTNNGAASGVVLPEDAYGFVVISAVDSDLVIDEESYILIGSVRILDDSGYEYRTNSSGMVNDPEILAAGGQWFFNFSSENGIMLSDIVGIIVDENADFNSSKPAVEAANLLDAYQRYDVDILDINENVFSCRNVVFACVNQEHPLLEELLEDSETNVASFEYGINEAMPHSRGGELLCPGNTISEGIVSLKETKRPGERAGFFIGLNNGNGRGTMDTLWGADLTTE